MPGIFKFRRSRGPVDLAVDMVGVRLGERLLQVGVAVPRVFALVSGKTGLTGRACAVVDTVEGGRALEEAARREGVLVEVLVATDRLPVEDASFDVGIVDGDALLAAGPVQRADRLRGVARALRPGGRVLLVRRWPQGLVERLGFTRESTKPSAEAEALVEALRDAAFRPVRLLAEREGLTFVEGFRPAG